jgi:DNA modification methylase
VGSQVWVEASRQEEAKEAMREPTILQGDSRLLIPEWLPHWPKIDCLLTDPPYGVAYQSTFGKNKADIEKYQQKIQNDGDPKTALATFDEVLTATIPFMADECEIYVFSDWGVCELWKPYLDSLQDHGIRLMQLIIWEKGYPGLGDFTYNWGQGHEFIWYLKKGNRPVPYRRSGILHVDKVRPGSNIHPTEKPQGLLKMLIDYSTVAGQFVFDPYAGSGSTVLAATEMGREALGIELEPGYVDGARARLPLPGLFSL